jgi:hypothetical protein
MKTFTSRAACLIVAAALLAAPASWRALAQTPPAPKPPEPTPAPVVPSAELTLPMQVIGEAGAFIRVSAATDCKSVKWVAMDPGLNVFPADLLKNSLSTVVIGGKPGVYRLLAYTACGDTPSDPAITMVIVTAPVVPTPGPEPNPPNPPTPTPPAPAPGQISVLFVDNVDDYGKPEYQPYLEVLNSSAIVDYLNSHCAKVGSTPEWRHWDVSTDVSHESQKWQDAMKLPRASLPWIAITNGKTGYSGPLPKTEAETLALLKQWGDQ